MKLFVALHVVQLCVFQILFYQQKHKLLKFSLITMLGCSNNKYIEPSAQWRHSLYVRKLLQKGSSCKKNLTR